MSPVAVLGATGQVGLFAIEGLLRSGREVIAVTREPAQCAETGVKGLRRASLAQVKERLIAPVDAQHWWGLLSCGPVALAADLLEMTHPGGEPAWARAVVVGTTSTLSKRDSSDSHERRLIAEIESRLDAIRRRCAAEEIPLTVLHPTLVYGCGMDQNLSRVYRWITRRGFVPVAADASGLRQPLHVADLSEALVRALQLDPAPELETPICGGSTLEYCEMIGLLFEAAGRKKRFLRIPPAAFGLVASLSNFTSGKGNLNPEMFRRQAQDLVFDDSVVRDQLNHAPRPFQPTQADFRLPPHVEPIRAALLQRL